MQGARDDCKEEDRGIRDSGNGRQSEIALSINPNPAFPAPFSFSEEHADVLLMEVNPAAHVPSP